MRVKSTLVLFTCLLVFTSSYSQFSKGDRLIGGNIALNNNSGSSTNMNNVSTSNNVFGSLTPKISWVTSNRTMQGVQFQGNYSRSKAEFATGGEQISKNYSIGAGYFLRNFKAFSEKFGWFIEYSTLASHTWNVYPGLDNRSKSVGLYAGATPGIFFLVSKYASLEASFGGLYASYYYSTGQHYDSKTFSAGLNFPSNFSFGMQLLLNKKQKP